MIWLTPLFFMKEKTIAKLVLVILGYLSCANSRQNLSDVWQ